MWARVDVVTNGDVDYRHALNPIVPALEAMVASGELQSNVHIHKVRPKRPCFFGTCLLHP